MIAFADFSRLIKFPFRCKNTRTNLTLIHNGSSIVDPSVITEVFNNYFSNITFNFDSNIPHSNISPLHFLGAPSCGKFIFLPPVILIRRQKNKSTDLMNIPVFIYRILAPLISPTVSMLFNNSLSQGIFPECFKSNKIISILNLVTKIPLRIIDQFSCYTSCQKCLKN